MIFADKISFHRNDVKNLKTIVRIYLSSPDNEITEGWYFKEEINDFLHEKPHTIKVNIDPYPYLIPVNDNNIKYVRSSKDDTEKDNLLKLDIFEEPY
ncbi:DUF3892 domain-containing protein [Fructilactobacillus cliffordii]|uniref:DUF3892 domain-containing protein n=1 Tax=Fructilactobacillus cliffordii TaxID=2940299 RepID=A0A9Q9E091_9LACO|nr:DUF3892 domain-containing protein [Fructilactobacillus cliffordii]USS88956.1 DUF3892 domain-containing protein [Fructilactobacillus cliffordii]